MKKFSVIIPTLWRAKEIYETIDKASKCSLVGEVIVIDNAPEKKRKKIKSNKVRVISKGKNIYVNKSWNWGIKTSKYDRICICNDDITFNVRKTLKFLKKKRLKDLGIVGCVRIGNDGGGKIEIKKTDNFAPSSFGVLMFIHKEEYEKIPKYVKIWWGDYWLFRHSEKRHVIQNIGLEGKYKTSVDSFKFQTEKDTFKKYTKMDPYIEYKESKSEYKLVYPLYVLKGYIKYFATYPIKRISGYAEKIFDKIQKA